MIVFNYFFFEIQNFKGYYSLWCFVLPSCIHSRMSSVILVLLCAYVYVFFSDIMMLY